MDAQEFEELFARKQSYKNIDVIDGEMSPRERFFATMDFQKPDRIIDHEFGYWNDTLRRWHKEGLPAFVDNNAKADVYFGFDNWSKGLPAKTRLDPGFPSEIISDDGRHQIILNSERIKCEIFTDGTDTIPHYLDFPIKDRASYQDFKERLKPDIEKRIPVDIAEVAAQVKDRNYVLTAPGGSTAGLIRNWMGFENFAMGLYDQPDLIEEILNDLMDISEGIARAYTRHLTADLVSWWEDIAFKNGPIVTPDFFITKCGPAMRRVMDVYRAHGTKYAFVDCDGDFSTLMPAWLDNGINIMFPLEVAAGIHPETLRRRHPGIRMMGGVDKTVLLGTKDDIRRELLKLKPIVDEGGFIPHVDHRVQADVSYENYLYYLEVKRDLFDVPNRTPEAESIVA